MSDFHDLLLAPFKYMLFVFLILFLIMTYGKVLHYQKSLAIPNRIDKLNDALAVYCQKGGQTLLADERLKLSAKEKLIEGLQLKEFVRPEDITIELIRPDGTPTEDWLGVMEGNVGRRNTVRITTNYRFPILTGTKSSKQEVKMIKPEKKVTETVVVEFIND